MKDLCGYWVVEPDEARWSVGDGRVLFGFAQKEKPNPK